MAKQRSVTFIRHRFKVNSVAFCFLTAAVGVLLLVPDARAQVPLVQVPATIDPGAAQQQSMQRQRQLLNEQQQRQAQPIPEQPLDTSGVKQPGALGTTAPEVHFLLKGVEFSASQILTREQLDQLAAPYIGHDVSLGQLQQLIAQVNALYRKKGAIAAEAVLPPQDVTDGIVKVRLVEGHIGRYRLHGNDSIRESYVLARLHTAPGGLLDTNDLERDLNWFNHSSNGAQLRAELVPGETFGTTDVNVNMTEPKHQSLSLFTDSAGSPTTGRTREGLLYTNRSLFGLTDELVASVTHADGYAGQAVSYTLPVNTWGGRLQIGNSIDRTHILYGSFAALDVSGKADANFANLTQPVFVTQNGQVDAKLSYTERRSETFINPILLQEVHLSEISTGLDWNFVDTHGLWMGELDYVGGHEQTPDRSAFNLVRGNLRRDETLPDNFVGRLTLNFQSTSRPLLPDSEQFFIGGYGSVRGYTNQAYFGDHGYVANLEVHHDIPRGPLTSWVPTLSGFVFYDYGVTRPVGPGQQQIRLESTGVGAEASIGPRVYGRVSLGHPLLTRGADAGGYRVDFALVAEFL